jgi:murein DD-endopeptidase MepM/ murein hydrolase activator NlpD
LTQKRLQKKSKIYGKRGIVFQYPAVLYQKFKTFFWDRISIPPWFAPLQNRTLLFLVALILYCGHQHRQLDQMISINTSLRNTIYTQHGTLHEQAQEIMEQRLKGQDQEVALGNMNHRFQSMADQVRVMHHQTIQLVTFGEQIRTLADLEEITPSQDNVGIGGNAQDLSPIFSLSLDSPRDNDMDDIQKGMDATHKLLNQQTRNFKTLKDDLEIKNELLACTPSIKPTSGVITCKFGSRLSPFSGKREFHTGMDIANKKGTKVYASARGKVIFAKKKWLIGNLVAIDHGNNIITKYGHLDKFLVKKGDVVNRGDVIGLMGSTGKSTGPHVHYEVVVNGKSENPADYFSSKLAASKK